MSNSPIVVTPVIGSVPGEREAPARQHRVRRSSGLAASRRLELLSWLAPLGLLLAWEALARLELIPSLVLPAPSSVLVTAKTLWISGELQTHLAASLHRAALGFGVGTGFGLGLGLLVGLFPFAHALLDRSLQVLRAVPFLAILPLVIVWFGVGESGKVFLIALGSLFPMYLNTALGVRQVDPKLLEMGRLMGLGRGRLILYAVIPGALPSLLNGVRLALTTSWLALVIAETVGANSGIGFLATNAREFLQTDVMVLVIAIYALIGVASDLAARLLERWLLAWHPSYARARLS
ncbi:MAG TPA: ABC transporter permease subunit [Polyangiaceae bacterium]|nr:ABC transporter permease subunit [Polyangiaceae bacterium]